MPSRMQKCSACGKKCRATLNMCPTCHPPVKGPVELEYKRTKPIPGISIMPGWFIGPKTGHDIAQVHLSASQDEATQEAYARLFAASTKVLAALVRIVEWADAGCDPSADSIAKAKEAIALARK